MFEKSVWSCSHFCNYRYEDFIACFDICFCALGLDPAQHLPSLPVPTVHDDQEVIGLRQDLLAAHKQIQSLQLRSQNVCECEKKLTFALQLRQKNVQVNMHVSLKACFAIKSSWLFLWAS